jgi:hypothetical protein
MIPDEHLKHPCFRQPEQLDWRVWRYVDVPKLVSLLQTKSLYFSRIDRLHDVHEGKIGRHAEAALRAAREEDSRFGAFVDALPVSSRFARAHFVNCWCLHEHESDALWRIYGGVSNGGIALRTTYQRLVNHLPPTDFIGQVTYLDYDATSYRMDNVFHFIMHKRTQFSYEHEVRIVRTPYEVDADALFHLDRLPSGVACPIEPNDLIESIVTSPYSEDWFVDVVSGLAKTYGLTASVETSAMK